MKTSALTRREFLIGATLSGSLLVLECSACRASKPTHRVSMSITDLLKQENLPPAVGNRFLDEHPDEKNVSKLVKQLFPTLSDTSTSEELAALFRAQVQNEFEKGEHVSVDGWLIAKSEARLCALAALIGN